MDDYIPENVNLFKKRTTNDVIRKRHTEILDPVTNLETNSEVISFRFDTRDDNVYIDLSETELEMTVQVTKKDGTAITNDSGQYGVISNLSNSLISNLEFSINNKIIDQVWAYPYVAYYHTLFNLPQKSPGDKEVEQLFNIDEANLDTTVANNASNLADLNLGLLSRWTKIKNSKKYLMRSKLYSNLITTDHLILPGVDIALKLRRNADSFCLMDDENNEVKIKIVSAKLRLTTVELNEDVHLAHLDVLNESNANYSFQETALQTHVLSKDQRSFDLNNVYTEEQDSILMFFVQTDAASGSLQHNPFEFIHENVQEITIKQDDKLYTYKLDFENNNVLPAYTALKKRYPHLDLSFELYGLYPFFYFQLRPRGLFKNLENKSKVDLHIQFKDHLKRNVTLFLLSENCKEFQIDKEGNILLQHEY